MRQFTRKLELVPDIPRATVETVICDTPEGAIPGQLLPIV